MHSFLRNLTHLPIHPHQALGRLALRFRRRALDALNAVRAGGGVDRVAVDRRAGLRTDRKLAQALDLLPADLVLVDQAHRAERIRVQLALRA